MKVENRESTAGHNIELQFARFAPEVWEALEKLPRTGWVMRGVENPESVQEHTVSLLRLASSFENLSEAEKEGLLEMLEVHDWPEAIHGDQVILTYDDKERKTLEVNKFDQEYQALSSICEKLGEDGKKILNLWLRFETSPDEAAAFARQLDKYQAIEQALEYEKAQSIPLFKEFFNYSGKEITHPVLLERLKKLEAEWASLI